MQFSCSKHQLFSIFLVLIVLPSSFALADESGSDPAAETSETGQEESSKSDEAIASDDSSDATESEVEAQAQEEDEVILVTGSRLEELQSKSAVRSTVIDAMAIEDSGAETLAELLQHYPGIEINYSYRGGSVKIRGLDSKYVLVLVDGRRQIGDLGGDMDLERFPISQIERVEIVKGAGSALYGSRAVSYTHLTLPTIA